MAQKKNQDKKKIQESKKKATRSGELHKHHHVMAKSMAYLGMGVCLVFGLVLGTLLTDLFSQKEPLSRTVAQSTQTQEQEQRQQPVKQTAGQSSAEMQHIAELEKHCAEHPKEQSNWVDLGNAYFDANMPKEAIQAYTTALLIGPENPDVLTDLGIMYRRIKDYDQAISSFRKASALNPDHIPSQLNEGIVLLHDLHQKEAALLCWEKLLQKDPKAMLPNGMRLDAFIEDLRKK